MTADLVKLKGSSFATLERVRQVNGAPACDEILLSQTQLAAQCPRRLGESLVLCSHRESVT